MAKAMDTKRNCSEAEMRVNLLIDQLCELMNAPLSEGEYWYYVVFSPMNEAYIRDKEWFRYKGLDKCRQKIPRGSCNALTREILDCSKMHINALVRCKQNVVDLLDNKKAYNKYHMYVSVVGDTPEDKKRVIRYMFKEASKRPFHLYQDYLYYMSADLRSKLSANDKDKVKSVLSSQAGIGERPSSPKGGVEQDSDGKWYLDLWP